MSEIRIALSYQDLQRLIGGEDTASIEVRNAIAQEFTKKHLKAIAPDMVQEEYKRCLREAFQQVLKEQHEEANLLVYLRKAIRDVILHRVEEIVSLKTEERMKEINQRIDVMIDGVFQHRVNKEVEKRIAQLKEAL